MRFFVALLPPADVVRDLAAVIAALPGDSRPEEAAAALRWTSPDRWHVTLAFLGTVDPEVRAGLAERLGRVAHRHPPVELRIDGAGQFGQRVLWARVAGDLGPLTTGVRRAAIRAGAADGDDRPLRAHLTLARVRPGADIGLRELAGAVDQTLVRAAAPLSWTARAMMLMSSSGGSAPVYSIEGEWDLRGSSAGRWR